MAVPVDYQQFWDKGNAGIANAMPHLDKLIQDKKPGSPEMEAYINNKFEEFKRRRLAGEDPAKITEDLMQDFQQNMSGGPGTVAYAEQQAEGVPSVGVNKGITSLGTPDMQNVTSQPPNSFPAAQPQQPGGISGNVVPAPQTAAPVVPQQPAPQPTGLNASGGGFGNNVIQGVTPEDAQTMQAANTPNPAMQTTVKDDMPIPYEEKPKIDLTAGRIGGSMSTKDSAGVKAAPVTTRNRGEQEQAMGDIERMSKLDNSETALDIKQQQVRFKTQLDMIKSRAKELRLSEKDKSMIMLSFKGLTAKEQMFVASEWAKKLNNDMKFKLGTDRNTNTANKAQDKMPIELKDAKENYHKAALRATTYMGRDKVQINANEAHRVSAEREQTRKDYNRMVEDYNSKHGTTIATIALDGRYVKPAQPTSNIDYAKEDE